MTRSLITLWMIFFPLAVHSSESCNDYDPLRRAFFGDLHVHSSYSFDSWTSGQRNDPDAAYRFARGEPIELPSADGESQLRVRLRRPLDFASVTDHAEFFGEIRVCTLAGPTSPGWWAPHCILTRVEAFYPALVASSYWAERIGEDANPKTRSYVCRWFPAACAQADANVWADIQRATEAAQDRSPDCRFTSFVGYEYTDTPNMRNMHRNVIFRDENVTALPIDTYDTGARNFPELWRRLRSECIEADNGCDVMSIPHNSNLAGGLMFRDPANEQEARDRLFFEPIVELIQHKAASECRFDRSLGRGVGTEDELCSFEQNRTDNLTSLAILFGELQDPAGAPVALDEFAPRNLMRNVLKDGLALGQATGTNPFTPGFIGSTDTHSATPGATAEDGYAGHLGRRDVEWRNVEDHYQDNPGGLAVVWAEENSRDALFDAMRRRETYATSGTRPQVRFFGGWEYPDTICEEPELAARGYAGGVPMGGNLPPPPSDIQAPRFVLAALKDPGTAEHPGTDLQRLQIVKGWVDAMGETHEQVIDAVGSADNGADVDRQTCAPTGYGAEGLCTVFEDPDFDRRQPAFYYLRVLENPTCRWSSHQCMAAGVNPFAPDCPEQARIATADVHARGGQGDVYGNCCHGPDDEPFITPIIQERAWTSPIWYTPPKAP
ncbi:DUF3604 domain-containing protein [Myxococcota bacterium]|nr:DUF3604 domain-containing protein [Myxococcota bacterium]